MSFPNFVNRYIPSFKRHFGVEIHAQNSGIHSQKSDSNHYFGVDSTIIWEWIQLQIIYIIMIYLYNHDLIG